MVTQVDWSKGHRGWQWLVISHEHQNLEVEVQMTVVQNCWPKQGWNVEDELEVEIHWGCLAAEKQIVDPSHELHCG